MYPILLNLNWASISSWDDLEKNIIVLPNQQARGEAFEEFCHAYFSIQKDLYQAQQVWRYADTPTDLLNKKLGSSTHQDEGIDGIILHYDGTVTAYQAKFRTSRNDIPSQRELSTFYMVSDRADYRLVISNVEDLPRAAKERKAHGQILVEDLLELEQGFFRQIHEHVNAGHATQDPPPTQKPFQVEAIRAITEGLSEHPRGQAILACGSGKTLIGKWVVDRLDAKWVLLMVPSLALIRQTLAEWHRSGTQPFRYLCVCSDETVDYRQGNDPWEISPSETDIRVTTNASVLVSFLKQQESFPRVVFSTYQSSPVIVKALKDSKLANFYFDLTICDEAHRIAGGADGQFSQVLHEHLIPSKKRLFMTATPRVVSPRLAEGKSKDADPGPAIFSMDDRNIFGPELYRFAFGQAIQEKIICDYRVLIIGVLEEEIAGLVRSKGAVQLEDSETWQAESLAQRIALGKAIATYGIRKAFCFHNRVQSASRFVDSHLPDSFPSVLNKMKPDLDYVALHISGEMSTATRSRILREFRMSPRGVVSNARCLGEGVNVPIVDAVFFADPRRSVIDIVQATGRALRQSPGKDRAYIIIPVLVKEDEDPEAILEDSRFDVVWKVLSAMASQDERLDIAIREARIKQGEGKLSMLGMQDLPSPADLPDCNAVLMGFPTRFLTIPEPPHTRND